LFDILFFSINVSINLNFSLYVEALNFAKPFRILTLKLGSNVDYDKVVVYSRVLIVFTESGAIFYGINKSLLDTVVYNVGISLYFYW